jgi:dihydropyrimidinase
MKSLLIKNGIVVTATDTFQADVYIENEKVHTIGTELKISADQTIDASGCFLFPGGIDPHTHMELPFMGTFASDTFESGTLAALHGGTTTIIDFAIQTQGDTLNAALNQWHEKADGKAVGDYAFHVGVTDVNPKTLEELKDIVEKEGVSSFKTFMAYKGALMVDDRQMIELMEAVSPLGGMVTTHAENGDLVDHLVSKNKKLGNTHPKYHVLSHPALAEAEATGRALDLAYSGGHPFYVVHLTCEEALDRVRQSTKRGQKVFIETCVQYLLLDESLYFKEGFEGSKWVMSPPLRKEKDRHALWDGINQNLVHTVATDHCPFCMNQKEMGIKDFSKIPNGAPGVEHRMELMYSEGVEKGKITLNKFVEVTSTASAKIFGLFPKKGTIAVGGDADIIVFDPKIEHTLSSKTHHMNCDYSAYEGWQVKGKVRTTILRGTVAVDQGKALVGKGFGKYLPRSQSGKMI